MATLTRRDAGIATRRRQAYTAGNCRFGDERELVLAAVCNTAALCAQEGSIPYGPTTIQSRLLRGGRTVVGGACSTLVLVAQLADALRSERSYCRFDSCRAHCRIHRRRYFLWMKNNTSVALRQQAFAQRPLSAVSGSMRILHLSSNRLRTAASHAANPGSSPGRCIALGTRKP